MNCPKCGSSKITEVPNNTLDVAVKCDDCGYEDFVNEFEKQSKEEIKSEEDRFIILQVKKPKECTGCEYDWKSCEITCPHNTEKGKTKEQYVKELEEIIYSCSKVSLSMPLEKAKNDNTLRHIDAFKLMLKQAKAVADNLFREAQKCQK